MPFATAHPYEIGFFIMSLVATVAAISLFVMKVSDLILVKANKDNGAIEFNATEKVRKQGFLLLITGVCHYTSITSINNTVPPSTQVLNLLSSLLFVSAVLVIDSYFTYRKRLRLPRLIAKAQERPGGRRVTDPPA